MAAILVGCVCVFACRVGVFVAACFVVLGFVAGALAVVCRVRVLAAGVLATDFAAAVFFGVRFTVVFAASGTFPDAMMLSIFAVVLRLTL